MKLYYSKNLFFKWPFFGRTCFYTTKIHSSYIYVISHLQSLQFTSWFNPEFSYPNSSCSCHIILKNLPHHIPGLISKYPHLKPQENPNLIHFITEWQRTKLLQVIIEFTYHWQFKLKPCYRRETPTQHSHM